MIPRIVAVCISHCFVPGNERPQISLERIAQVSVCGECCPSGLLLTHLANLIHTILPERAFLL